MSKVNKDNKRCYKCCIYENCNKPRHYTIGNEKYFCIFHHREASKYTRIELEKLDGKVTS